MIITKIEPQRRNKQRFSIFIDNEFAFGLSGVDVLYYKLEEGWELPPERYDFLINEVLFREARDSALKYLGYRQRTRAEILHRLEEYPAEIPERVLAELEGYGYVNDYAFAQDYVEARIRSKAYGKLRLYRELREKGVEKDVIEEVLAGVEFDEVSAAVAKLRRKARDTEIEECDRRRYTDYLTRQGYSCDIIRQAFEEYEV